MVRVTITFPLGVYHAQSPVAFGQAEWPPSPVRLIGGLLAAAHGRAEIDPEPARALLQRLCEEPSPTVVAPPSIPLGETSGVAGAVVRFRGASRWAPRNHTLSELKGLSTRNVGRGRSAVEKVGTAIGCHPVHMLWGDLELDDADLDHLTALASDVTFLGTARSPVVVDVDRGLPDDLDQDHVWEPVLDDRPGLGEQVEVRVPEPGLIRAFDRREALRRTAKPGLERIGLIPGARFGRDVLYARVASLPAVAEPVDPRQWGEMLVLAVDREASDTVVKAPASYLLARAVRVSLLGAFGAVGAPDEAPEIVRARGADPHCAIVPLPFVGHEHADGHIMGVAVVLPHPSRIPDFEEQRARVQTGLLRFSGIGGERRYVDVPGGGRVFLRIAGERDARLRTLREATYRGPSACWVSATPVVHSRWKTSSGPTGLLRQITADCRDVGLPEPRRVEVLPGSGCPGGAYRLVPTDAVPPAWRDLLRGPVDHVRVTFDEPVVGPVLLGRARHFGLGLCLPEQTVSHG